jgi:uncharacterized protein (TIGR02453 family)
MAEAFNGFGRGLVPFFSGLVADNSREYWRRNKKTYETEIAEPLRALAEALEDEFGTIKIFRPNRDLRFSSDRRPYQEHARAMATKPGAAGSVFLQVSADGLFLGGGTFHPAPEQVTRWRAAVDDEKVAAELTKTIEKLDAAGFPLLEGNSMTGTPRGWSKDHPRIDLIRRRNLAVGRAYDADVLYSRACLDIVRHGWSTARVWVDWLDEHVGPGESVGRRR